LSASFAAREGEDCALEEEIDANRPRVERLPIPHQWGIDTRSLPPKSISRMRGKNSPIPVHIVDVVQQKEGGYTVIARKGRGVIADSDGKDLNFRRNAKVRTQTAANLFPFCFAMTGSATLNTWTCAEVLPVGVPMWACP
jgi:hypothetical protein